MKSHGSGDRGGRKKQGLAWVRGEGRGENITIVEIAFERKGEASHSAQDSGIERQGGNRKEVGFGNPKFKTDHKGQKQGRGKKRRGYVCAR